MKQIVEILTKNNETISFMESCTGGALANEITNIEGASKVFKLSYVTYCNEAKILNGVDKDLIDKYTVYSKKVAASMAKACSISSNSTYGVGITGELGKNDDKVYIGIYSSKDNKVITEIVEAGEGTRIEKKKRIVEFVKQMILTRIAK